MSRRFDARPPMPDPLAYFLTWGTYGSWLPGDERGWVKRPGQFREPNHILEIACQERMVEDGCALTLRQRKIVEQTVADHCTLRGWRLHAVNCRTQHIHVVVTAKVSPENVMSQFKAWCSRRLNQDSAENRQNWWAERGSRRYINDEASLEAAIRYVRDGQ